MGKKRTRYKAKAAPTVKTDERSEHCAFFLTPADKEYLANFAEKAGFRSLGQLTTAIMERLIIGGFAPIVFLKTGFQLANFAEKNGAEYGASFLPALYFGLRPLPALPEERISDKDLRSLVLSLSAEKTKNNKK